MRLKKFVLPLFVFIAAQHNAVQAEQAILKPFVLGSYQHLVTAANKQPFMLVIWSMTCSSCLKDMALLSKLHKNKPDFKMVMLATDGAEAAAQIEAILVKNKLTTVENWHYADENTPKLQYEIDSTWYGELPRTYFFDKAQHRIGISGVLTEADYLSQFEKIVK
jgi:thiol-disulfide isomerase/thioredoxin